jgi:hypothetical protein
MGSIRKPGPYNPQKATAYVGKGVLKNGGDTIPAIKGAITPVPNGPLIKKKGPFKGSTLKNGGKVVSKPGAWTRKEGQSPTGGLNAKGRASLKAQGQNIKPPQPQGGPRKKSYCARSAGQMKMFPKAAKNPKSRLRLARKKWKC